MEAVGRSAVPVSKTVYVMHDLSQSNDDSVIGCVDSLLKEAVLDRITDIHIEPYAKHCRIRFRRDGLLYEVKTLPNHLSHRIITRLKIMAELNIAERRLPQDGRIRLLADTPLDIRLSTCPTLFGEKMVLRLLNTGALHVDVHALGFNAEQKNLFLTQLTRPQGLILVTGPTGSGKTMTLYAALHYLNAIEKNISTVEDPVEMELTGINQVNINPTIGLDFSVVLRTFLRQDPDVIMVGEIRDTETANIAAQAAQTGHLVLSTLHANSAMEAMTRLQAMGVAAHHLIHSVSLIIAQRLARQLCLYCKQVDTELGCHLYKALGCNHCYQGYKGRVGLFELLPFPDLNNPSKVGPTLWEAGLEKAKAGITSYAELVRVIGHAEL